MFGFKFIADNGSISVQIPPDFIINSIFNGAPVNLSLEREERKNNLDKQNYLFKSSSKENKNLYKQN